MRTVECNISMLCIMLGILLIVKALLVHAEDMNVIIYKTEMYYNVHYMISTNSYKPKYFKFLRLKDICQENKRYIQKQIKCCFNSL